MDILKCLPGECGTPVCIPVTWKMLKERFLGKVIHCISAKKTYSKIHCKLQRKLQVSDTSQQLVMIAVVNIVLQVARKIALCDRTLTNGARTFLSFRIF